MQLNDKYFNDFVVNLVFSFLMLFIWEVGNCRKWNFRWNSIIFFWNFTLFHWNFTLTRFQSYNAEISGIAGISAIIDPMNWCPVTKIKIILVHCPISEKITTYNEIQRYRVTEFPNGNNAWHTHNCIIWSYIISKQFVLWIMSYS